MEKKAQVVHHSPMEVCELQNGPCVDMANVFDIDAEDEDNPQLVSEYVNDIYAYLRELEVRLNITSCQRN